MAHIGWSELETLERVVALRSVEAAGRALGLRHSTVSRRIAAVEARLGAALFVRGPRLTPTALALRVAGRAASMREAADAIEAMVEAERRLRDETLVVTTSDVLAPLLCRALAEAALSQRVSLLVSDDEVALVPGEVDLALRPGKPQRDTLRGRRLGRLKVGLYVAPGGEGRWVLPDAALREKRSMPWWRHVPEGAPGAVQCSTLLAMRDACAAGLGRAALPAFLAGQTPSLRLERSLEGAAPLWLLAPATLGTARPARSAQDALAAALRGLKGVFVDG
ncbi:MAG: LysR family transcriptional regulator [Myxococcales bacterium]|nr:LysR family transcriptional regulator [Myxococcales bacterium]